MALWSVEGMDIGLSPVGFAPPVADGLVGWGHLDSSTIALRNRAESSSDLTPRGAPVYSSGYVSFATQNDGLDSQILDSDAITLLAVARSSASFAGGTTRPNFLGTYASQGGGIAGAALYVTGTPSAAPAATVNIGASRDVGGGVPGMSTASITVADFSKWTFLAGIVQAGAVTDGRKLIDKTNGVTGVSTPATARVRNNLGTSSGKNRVGGITSLLYGPVDVCWWAIYHRALLTTEVDKNYAFVKRRFADKFGFVF
jgi:hypothetical protein